jgi:hypothetical protein
MAIDKSLAQAPVGLDLEDEPSVEVEVAPEDETEGGLEVLLDDAANDDEENVEFNENLAEVLDDMVLATLAGELIGDYDEDVMARQDWITTYVDGLELLGMKFDERSEPWEGACGVYHPLLSEALVKFQAETMMETFPPAGPVRTQIIGKETPAKKDAALRVEADMNYQLTDVMIEYRPEHERMLWGLGLAGNAFKKVYYDPSIQRQTSIYVPAEDVVVPYGATSLETAGRVTHVMRKTANELRKLQKAGFYKEAELPEPADAFDEVERKIAERMGFRVTNDDRHKLLEMHVDLVIDDDPYKDEDGVALPYVVTVEKNSQEILAIRRNWNPDDPSKQKRNHFVHYGYVPGFGFYCFGLVHLVGAFAKSGTSLLRQLVDAGTLANLPAGFKTKGLRIKDQDSPLSPAEFRDVDVASGTIRDNILPLPYKEPSQVLAALLDKIVEEGRRFAGAADLQLSDMSAQAPVGTTLAILERTLKVMSAVQARIHAAMRREFKLLKEIIREYTPEDYSYDPEEGDRKAKRSDYSNVDVLPVSDPNAATMAQKVVQYQAVLQMAQMAPQIYDLPFLHRQMIEIMGVKNAAKIIPIEDDRKPQDPVSENMACLTGKPMKAFIYQDHEAHIAVHTAMMQDPKIAQLMGQNPQAQLLMGAMQSHIMEHMAFAYRKQVEDMAGVPYPAPDAPMDEETEVEVSRLAAAASQKVLQKNQQEAAAQAAQQAAQDPVMQMQKEELEIKRMDAQTKAKKVDIDASTAQQKLALEHERIEAQKEIAGLNAGVKAAGDQARLEHDKERMQGDNEAKGMKLGADIAKSLRDGDREDAKAESDKKAQPRKKKDSD